MTTSPRITPTSKHIAVKYHWFRKHDGKEYVISEDRVKNHKADISPKVYKVKYLQGLVSCYAVGKTSDEMASL